MRMIYELARQRHALDCGGYNVLTATPYNITNLVVNNPNYDIENNKNMK